MPNNFNEIKTTTTKRHKKTQNKIQRHSKRPKRDKQYEFKEKQSHFRDTKRP